MILTLNLTQFETHTKLVDEVVLQFGKVCRIISIFNLVLV